MAVLRGGAVSYERGTPVVLGGVASRVAASERRLVGGLRSPVVEA